jgi:hypothetical protein
VRNDPNCPWRAARCTSNLPAAECVGGKGYQDPRALERDGARAHLPNILRRCPALDGCHRHPVAERDGLLRNPGRRRTEPGECEEEDHPSDHHRDEDKRSPPRRPQAVLGKRTRRSPARLIDRGRADIDRDASPSHRRKWR